MMADNIPHVSIPAGDITVQVRIIDTTSRIDKIPLTFLMRPAMEPLEYMPSLPSWSFLIEHPSGHKTIFDLGLPKNIKELAPLVSEDDRFEDWDIHSPREVIDILEGNDIAGTQINSVIWSHWHWDHIGDPSRFPPTTDLIVGPGFREALLPAYPTKSDSPVRESDFRGRKVIEINTFDKEVVEFPAHDFFGDGSFYLLDTPGHAIGHIGALARTTTNPDTFIFMGGDLSHHGGQMRPSKHMHIPAQLTGPNLHLGSLYQNLLVSRTGSTEVPFFLSTAPQVVDEEELARTRSKAQKADAQENIWLVCAHDPVISQVADFFPASANDWKAKGWRSQTLWSFLDDFKSAVDKTKVA